MDNLFISIFNIIETEEIKSKEDFDNLIKYLTNHPTPLREACAYKLEDIYCDNFLDEKVLTTLLNAITDINPNISRSICNIIKKSVTLKEQLCPKIILNIENLIGQLPETQRKQNNKNHAKNKILFALYWLMEALFYCYEEQYRENIVKIINKTIAFCDFTIREKSAQLLTKVDNPPTNLIKCIKNDSNFYVNFYAKFM